MSSNGTPIVIYRTVDRDGETFALEPESRKLLEGKFGEDVHIRGRLFIAHEPRSDYEAMHASIVSQVVQLLTGLSLDRIAACGEVQFLDPVTEQRIPLKAA